MQELIINNIKIYLPEPLDTTKYQWIGQKEYLDDLLTSFMVLSDDEQPLTPKITGKPGIGKTTLVAACAKELNLPLYIMQCSADTRPEDLLVTPVLNSENQIIYVASPLLAGIINGGVVILDEANRMPEKSWATLASLFDDRRSVSSIIVGQTFKAHKNFRCAITVNEDSSVYDIPDYIENRLAPIINLEFPNKSDEFKILKYHLPFIKDEILEICVNFMQEMHQYNLPYSIRDAINALKLLTRTIKGDESLNQMEYLFYKSLSKVLGKSIQTIKNEIEEAKITMYNNDINFSENFLAEEEFTDMFDIDDFDDEDIDEQEDDEENDEI